MNMMYPSDYIEKQGFRLRFQGTLPALQLSFQLDKNFRIEKIPLNCGKMTRL